MKNAITLLRVSSTGQTKRAGADQGYSLEAQRRGCYAKAEQMAANVVHEFVAPAESASNGMYRTLKEVLAFVEDRRDISYLIVNKLDRFSRDEKTNWTVYADLAAAGCELVSVTENIDGSPQGLFMMGILSSVAALESRQTGRRVLDGLITKARNGGTPKRAPLGYLNVRTWDGPNDIRTVEVDPERAPYIRWAFVCYATGEFTLNQLVEELWERGLRTRATSKNPEGKLGRSALARILKDPYYIGVVRYRDVDYDGHHPTFIDPETFRRVQEVLESHHLAGEKHWRHSHPLKGTMFCGYCGERMQFVQAVGRGGVPYRYFVCFARHAYAGCKAPYLREADVEYAVASHYASTVRFDAKRVEDLESRLATAFEAITAYRDKQLNSERRLVARLDGERRRLLDAHLAGAVPLDLLSEKQQEITANLAAAKGRLLAAQQSSEAAVEALHLSRKLLHEAGEAYHEADAITQRAWNQALFSKLFVKPADDGEPVIVGTELTEPYAQLLSEDLANALESMQDKEPAAFAAGGSNVDQIVETVGIEPTSAIA